MLSEEYERILQIHIGGTMNIDSDETSIHVTGIESKQLRLAILDEINTTVYFWKNVGEEPLGKVHQNERGDEKIK